MASHSAGSRSKLSDRSTSELDVSYRQPADIASTIAKAKMLGELLVETTDGTSRSDPEARFQWTLNYCKAHPLDDLAKVASALYIDLSARGM